jgi:hypothetical protein
MIENQEPCGTPVMYSMNKNGGHHWSPFGLDVTCQHWQMSLLHE